jgi:N-acetyl-alpha-D-glucosaminyl L-malate synthase BshA
MNIGIVCYPTYGGSGIVATELGSELARQGHKVHFISYALPTRLDKFQNNIFYHDVEFPHYPLFDHQLYTLALAGKIIDVIKYEKIDILHVHYAIPHTISGILAKQIMGETHNFKLVTTLHGTDITLVGLEPAFHPLVKYSLDQSDAVTAVSNYLAEKTVQNFNPSNKIEVIYNFIDPEFYKRHDTYNLKSQLAPYGEKVLMHISNFRPVKRVSDTIKILKEIIKKHSAKLLLVGDGPDRTECENLVRELNLNEHVRFLGKQTSIVELLSIADLFLLPSQSESFGLSALEAMSCGVPVIGSNIGGIPEVVAHGETGYVAELGDVERMAKYAISLFDNPKKLKIFSENARKVAIEKFDSNIIVPQYIKLYERLLNN